MIIKKHCKNMLKAKTYSYWKYFTKNEEKPSDGQVSTLTTFAPDG